MCRRGRHTIYMVNLPKVNVVCAWLAYSNLIFATLFSKSLPHQNIVFVYKFSYKSNIIVYAALFFNLKIYKALFLTSFSITKS